MERYEELDRMLQSYQRELKSEWIKAGLKFSLALPTIGACAAGGAGLGYIVAFALAEADLIQSASTLPSYFAFGFGAIGFTHALREATGATSLLDGGWIRDLFDSNRYEISLLRRRRDRYRDGPA